MDLSSADVCPRNSTCIECLRNYAQCEWCASWGCYHPQLSSPCGSSRPAYTTDECPSEESFIYFVVVAVALVLLLSCMCLCKLLCNNLRSRALSANYGSTQTTSPRNSSDSQVEKKPLISPPPPPKAPGDGDVEEDARERFLCDICTEREKDIALGCGHMICEVCTRKLSLCPFCKEPIKSAHRVYL